LGTAAEVGDSGTFLRKNLACWGAITDDENGLDFEI
jgi:hypothetical protein